MAEVATRRWASGTSPTRGERKVAIAYALGVALAAFALTRRKKRPEYVAQEALPATSARTAALTSASEPGLAPAVDAPRGLPALMPSRTEVLINQLQESGRTNPEAWVGILRTWLSEEEAN